MSRNHKFSQNFLRSPQVAMMLVGHSNIRKNDFTLDIGAGSGVITYALSKKSKQVLAIEFDKITFSKLKSNTAKLSNVEILHADFLRFHLEKLPKNYKICANIPFHLSSKIIQKVAFSKNPPKSAYFILQKQFAKKLISSDAHFTAALGAKIFPLWASKIKKPLRKSDFTPPPAVDTVFFEMKIREKPLIPDIEIEEYCAFIDQMFANRDFYKKHSPRKFRTRTPSQLTGEEWIKIWGNRRNK